jgi:hypothetical protein
MLSKSCQSSFSACSTKTRNSGMQRKSEKWWIGSEKQETYGSAPLYCIWPSPLVSTALRTSWRSASAFFRAIASFSLNFCQLSSCPTMVHLLQALLEAMEVDLPIPTGIQRLPQLFQPLIPFFVCLFVHRPVVLHAVICGGSWSVWTRA